MDRHPPPGLPLPLAASGAIWLLAILLSASLAGSMPGAKDLVLGAVVERELPAGESHEFTFEARARDYVEISIEIFVGELSATLIAPDGRSLREHDDAATQPVSLEMAAIADASGTWRLVIASSDPDTGQKLRYGLTLAEKRPAEASDPERVEAWGLVGEGRTLLDGATSDEERRAAIVRLERALVLWRALGDPVGEAETQGELFDVYYDLGDTAKMQAAADQALALWRGTGRKREEGRALSQVGLAAYTAYDKPKALESYLAALSIHEAIADLYWESETLNRLGWYYRWVGDRPKAIEYYERALPLRADANDRPGQSRVLSDLGLAHYELGDVAAAIEDFERALALTSPEREPGRIANILARMGMIYNGTGEYQKSTEVFGRALEAAIRAGDGRAEASVQNNLAVAYEHLGEWEDAQERYRRALEASRKMGQRNGESSALNGLARVHRSAGNTAEATAYATQSLELSREIRDPTGEAYALRILGGIELDLHHDTRALEPLGQALKLYREAGLRYAEASTLNLLAVAHARLGDLSRAREESTAALAIARALRARDLESRTLSHLADWSLSSGDRNRARQQIEEAVRIGESLRQNFTRRDWRSSYFETVQDKYSLFIEILMSGPRERSGAGDMALALELSERSRARGLLDMLAESGVDPREGADAALLAREQALRRRVHLKAFDRERLLGGKHTEAQATDTAKELEDLTDQLSAVEAQVRASSPRYAALTQPQSLKAAAIQGQLLDEDTVLLEIALGERRSWLWAVTPSSISSYELPPRAAIEKLARAVYDALTARQPRSDENGAARQTRLSRADAELASQAAALSEMLLGKAAARLARDWRDKRLVIVAPGALEYVPFASLPEPVGRKDGIGAGARPLIANHEIISLPSASVLGAVRVETAGRPSGKKQVAVFADPVFDASDPRVLSAEREQGAARPAAAALQSDMRGRLSRLPFSREEAEMIASMVPADSLLKATGFAASRKGAMNDDLGQFKIVHFATHGLLDTDHPELSGLVFSLVDERGNPQDGFLRLNEIYNLRLPVELVVLSACQTALGKEVRGEGLVGLTRGFMYGGARRVVASLWRVDDLATSELMRLFYRGMLQNGQRPAAALRAAQVEMSRQKRWASPYYWAGFVIQGEWN